MTENKVIPEKQAQNLLIYLCNKAVRIHAFYLRCLHAVCQKPSVFSSVNSFTQKAEGREKQGQGKAGPLAVAGEGHLVTVGWEELPQPRGQRVGGSCLVAPLLVLD